MTDNPPKTERRSDSPRYRGMASDRPRTLREALKDIPPDDKQTEILISLVDDSVSHEAAAVVGASLVERALQQAITRFFSAKVSGSEKAAIFDIDKHGCLSDFSSKIKIAHVLGIGGIKTKEDLNRIRSIRNYFAHSPRIVTFDDPEVREICAHFHATADASATVRQTLESPKKHYVYAAASYHYRIRTFYPDIDAGPVSFVWELP